MAAVNKEAPAELVAKCEEINTQWLTGTDTVCEPYYANSDLRLSWKLRLVKRFSREEVLIHLDPTAADGHTYYLFVDQLKRKQLDSVEEGKMLALAMLTNHACSALGVKIPAFKKYYVKS